MAGSSEGCNRNTKLNPRRPKAHGPSPKPPKTTSELSGNYPEIHIWCGYSSSSSSLWSPKSTGTTTHLLSPQAPCPFMITLELSGNYTEFHVRGEDSLRTFIIVYRISKLIHTFWSQEDDFS